MEVSLYKGKIKVEFTEGSHRYKINGKSGCPSVTSVTGLLNKPALLFWSANLARDFLLDHLRAGTPLTEELIMEAAKQHTVRKEQAATSGTLVHQWASEYITGKNPEIPDDENVLRGVTAFLNWVKEHRVRFLASEQIVYSLKHNFVGIADAIAEIKKKIYLIDFKTSSSIYSEYYLQTAAYLKADEEESKRKYNGVKIVRFAKDSGEFEMVERTMQEVKTDYKAFVGMLQVKNWQKFVDNK